jgi:hypothetical protein
MGVCMGACMAFRSAAGCDWEELHLRDWPFTKGHGADEVEEEGEQEEEGEEEDELGAQEAGTSDEGRAAGSHSALWTSRLPSLLAILWSYRLVPIGADGR